MAATSRPRKSSRDKVRAHRARLRAQGLRPVQIWMPDTRSPEFAAEAHRQSLAIGKHPDEPDEQAWVDSLTDPDALYDFDRAVKRGEVWTAASAEHYAGKPRPVVIVQANAFDGTESIVVCGLTSGGPPSVPLPRPEVKPAESNGLFVPSRIMIDKVFAVPRRRLGRRIGVLSNDDMARLSRAIVTFLDLAG